MVSNVDVARRGVLGRFVEEIRVLTPPPGGVRAVDYLPDGRTRMLFRQFADGKGDVSVRGPYSRAYYKVAAALPLAIRVVFRPGGAYPFFGVGLDQVADRIVTLDQLWGVEGIRLSERLCAATSGNPGSPDNRRSPGGPGAAVALIEAALFDRLRRDPFEPASAGVARAAVRMIDEGGARSVAAIARTLGVSERHLRRSFLATVGVGPKMYARCVRFQRALALGRTRPGRWTAVAHQAGYFDQAHLIAEFRDLARVSPAAFDRQAEQLRFRCSVGA